MYSNSDFEKVWFLYKMEGEPKGIYINFFCVNQGVPYNRFNDWFRKTHKKIVPVPMVSLQLMKLLSRNPLPKLLKRKVIS